MKELREELTDLPEDMIVLLSSDAEGNTIHALDSVDVSAFYEDNDASFVTLHPDDVDGTEDHALVLWP